MNDTAASRRAATTAISPMEHKYEFKSGLPYVASTTTTPKFEEGRKRNPSGNWGSVSTENKRGCIYNFVWPCVQGRRNNKDPAPCVRELDREYSELKLVA